MGYILVCYAPSCDYHPFNFVTDFSQSVAGSAKLDSHRGFETENLYEY